MFNQDITIINKKYDSDGVLSYVATPIKGFWSSHNGITINNTDLVKTSGVIVRILFSEEGYITPEEFQEGTTGWTLQKDDYMVKGLVEETIDSITPIQDGYECMKITNIAIKDYGSSDMQHFEVSGE